MALEEYARKRSFEKTPEPAPAKPEAPTGNLYCIQRHLARRLHYDLRLEMGGTLKSWAVPQGPSRNPADKRLAVMVEDHPIEYGSFEGNIPKGNYGAGSVMLWDTGSYEVLGDTPPESQLDRGDLKIRLHGEKLEGDWALVRMKNRGKGNEWLLIKKKDAHAEPGWDIEQHGWSVKTGRTQEEIAGDMPVRTQPEKAPRGADPSRIEGAVKAPMPGGIPVMLAYSDDKPPAGKGWLYEIKWDGVRALCFLDEQRTRLVSRKGTEIDRQYPELSVLRHFVKAESAVIDGEIAAVDDNGRPSFNRIQPRIMASDPNAIAQMARSRPVIYFAFDLLYLNGYDLRGAALADRKRLLQSIVTESPVMKYSAHFESGGQQLLEAAREQGLEGIVAKRAGSRYYGARSKEWLKIKVAREQDFVLCGWTQGERDFFGALVLGVYDGGALQWAGNVGTGFDRKLMEAIYRKLEPLETPVNPFGAPIAVPQKIHWVSPELVCSVKYLEWTGEGRLRAPVFAGLRPDADPRECVRHPEAAVRAREPLLTGDKEDARIVVDGRPLKFTHLNKVLYPEEGYTKRDLVNYYDAVADLLIPHWKDRPLSLRRYVEGIAKEGFFQKNAASGFPDWMRRETILAEDGKLREQVIGNGRAELLYLTNLGCIDQNPWMSRVQSLDNPDFVLIDLDPSGCGFDKIVEAAQLVRRKLDLLELESYPKTTGGDGMHLYIPLEPAYSYEMSKAFAEIVARLVAAERPDLFTVPRNVARREKGKVYFDYLQNGRGKTISAPYVARAYPGAPVATPLEWREVARGLVPQQFHIRNAMERFDRVGDLFAGVLARPQRLEPALAKLEQLVKSG